MASGEALVTGGVIPADAPHLGAKGLKVGQAVAEGAGFHRAARRVVFRIEEQHQRLASELVAAALDAVGILQVDQGGQITRGERGWHGDNGGETRPP